MPSVETEQVDDTRVVAHLTVPVGMLVDLHVEVPRRVDGGPGPISVHVNHAPLPRTAEASSSGNGRQTLLSAVTAVRPDPVHEQKRKFEADPLSRLKVLIPSTLSTLAIWLFVLSVAVYMSTHLIGLGDWPIYFFTDEAVQANRAQELLRDGLRFNGELLPTFVQNGPFWNLGTSVYLQILPVALFGKSVEVTRGVSVLVTVVGAVALALMLRDGLAPRFWWAAVLILSTAPAWFLHSRTAFETVEMASLYAVFLACYLQYLRGRRRFLYLAVVAGAAAFYAYSPGQLVMVVTALGLLISNWRYHVQNQNVVIRALVLATILAMPFVRFQIAHPGVSKAQLDERGSILARPVPILEKLGSLKGNYLAALSPAYWFDPNGVDLRRHIMGNYAHFWPYTGVLALMGLLVCLRSMRSPPHRVVFVALLAAPTGAALADIGVTRAMAVVVPMVLLIVVGLEQLIPSLTGRRAPLALFAYLGIFLGLASLNVSMLRDALTNGPIWNKEYGLSGMQWGGRQLLGGLVPEVLRSDPNVRLDLSPTWANGTDELFDFFLSPQQRSRTAVRTVDAYLNDHLPIEPGNRLVMTAEEFGRAISTPRLKAVPVEWTLNYPDGRPGFYVARIEYADDIDAQLAAAREELQRPVSAQAVYHGEVLNVMHSRFGMGRAQDLFDGDPSTLVRGLEANPIRVDWRLPSARSVAQLRLTTGTIVDYTVRIVGYDGDREVARVEERFINQPPDPTVILTLGTEPIRVDRLVLEVRENQKSGSAQIHIREIEF